MIMKHRPKVSFASGMKTSPWIVLGSTFILLVVVLVMAYQNTNREKRYMSEILNAKGAALIRAVEAGARTGMMGMRWGGQQIQRLLEETARLQDVVYMAVIDRNRRIVAHSDSEKIGSDFAPGRDFLHLGPEEFENWALVTRDDGQRIFEVHRHFRPLVFEGRPGPGHMKKMMQHHGLRDSLPDDWFASEREKGLHIVIGLDVSPFEEAIRRDIQTTVLLSVVMLFLGFGGFVSLFWMNSYRMARRSLQDTSAFANEVVAHLPVGLIAADREGKITFFNSAAEKITGQNKLSVYNSKLDEILPGSFCGIRLQLERGEKITEKEVECVFGDHRQVPVSVSATRIVNDDGELIGQVLILRDLSEIRRLQDEIRRQEKLAAMGGLAAGVAHEVRNPLSSIKALATFFSGQFEDGSEAKEAATVMVQEVDRLNRVITELLDFSRPTDVKIKAEDLSELIPRSLQLIQQDAANKDIDLRLEMKKRLCRVWIDPDRMAQCLLNLYLNAIQAMEGGGTLFVSCEQEEETTVRITVRDTGKGMEPETKAKIFDPYFTTKNKGAGLGLAIVHKIIEAHRGSIVVESEPGKGTAFILRLRCEGNRRGARGKGL